MIKKAFELNINFREIHCNLSLNVKTTNYLKSKVKNIKIRLLKTILNLYAIPEYVICIKINNKNGTN